MTEYKVHLLKAIPAIAALSFPPPAWEFLYLFKRQLISIEKCMSFLFGPDLLSKLGTEGVKILADGLIC